MGFLHLDTGAMYRTVTLACRKHDLPPVSSPQLNSLLDELDIQFDREASGLQRVFLDGVDVTREIRSPEIDRSVSAYSAMPEIRQRLVSLQRQLAAGHDIVCEGRDIGTRVFPDAEHKFFLVADPEIRALRRQTELARKGHAADLQQIKSELQGRDDEDSRREHSPLVKAQDAITLDTSQLSIEAQVERVIAHIQGRSD